MLGDGTLTISDDEGINIWIIIGAILGAIALFAILVLILYKVKLMPQLILSTLLLFNKFVA